MSASGIGKIKANEIIHRGGREGREEFERKMEFLDCSGEIIGAAITVHRALGPGLLESTYEVCLAHELAQRGLRVERQKELPVRYGYVFLDCGYRIDLLVQDSVVVELKAAEKLLPIHEAQLLSYLKLSGCKVGLLINFNVEVLKAGIKRRVLNL